MFTGKNGPQLVTIDLEYRGSLHSGQNGHSDAKQELRAVFSPQLRRKWRDSRQLNVWDRNTFPVATLGTWQYESPVDANPFYKVNVCGFDVIPLVTWHNGLACRLDITVVGDTRSAAAVIGDGDLDNRLKVLFDGLRIPKGPSEVPAPMFGSGNDELFCLLEDDSLIHRFSVEAIQSPYSPAEYAVRIRAIIEPIDGTHGVTGTIRGRDAAALGLARAGRLTLHTDGASTPRQCDRAHAKR